MNSSYQVPCIYGQVCPGERLTVAVPGSKSITNRALLLATLAKGESRLLGALFSEDSRHFLNCVKALGFDIRVEEGQRRITVVGQGGAVPRPEAALYVGSAGTAARFLTAYLGVAPGRYHLDASPQMRKRPMAPLLACLKELGCQVRYGGQEGFFPFTLEGHGFCKQQITVDIGSSSQFLSALLISSVLSREDLELRVQGSHGMAYIDMTRRMMGQFGVIAEEREAAEGIGFRIPGGQGYQARTYQIEPDVSAACYFYGMAALLGIAVTVPQVHFESLQGDVEFVRILERMGCQAQDGEEGLTVLGPEKGCLRGVEADMSACSDQAITLAALAPFAGEPTRITGIGHIRLQESDRVHGIATELNRMGIRCVEGKDFLEIWPGEPRPCLVDTYEDHRMAMGFSLTGLRAEGIAIDNPACCRKTFEEYFEVLDDCVRRLRKL